MAKPRWLDRRIAAPGPYLALCLSQDEFDAACRHLKCDGGRYIKNDHSDATTHYMETDRGIACIVCIRGWEKHKPIEVAGLLVHEAVHVWQEYAARLGEHQPGAEQEAYAIQSIAQELMVEFADRLTK